MVAAAQQQEWLTLRCGDGERGAAEECERRSKAATARELCTAALLKP